MSTAHLASPSSSTILTTWQRFITSGEDVLDRIGEILKGVWLPSWGQELEDIASGLKMVRFQRYLVMLKEVAVDGLSHPPRSGRQWMQSV